MIEKVVHKFDLKHFSEVQENLKYWLSKTPEERVEAVEILSRQHYGNTGRIQKVVRVFTRSTKPKVMRPENNQQEVKQNHNV